MVDVGLAFGMDCGLAFGYVLCIGISINMEQTG